MDTTQLEALIRAGETLDVEFKSDLRQQLSDHDIFEHVVCLANGQRGVLLIGIENDGRVSGARPRHRQTTQPRRLESAIFNNTVPPIDTRVSLHTLAGQTVIAIEVLAPAGIYMTRRGVCLRRVMGAEGPECRPFYPHEHVGRRIDLGLTDYTVQTLDNATWDDLDPIELVRLKQTIERRPRADKDLVGLGDQELVRALQLVETRAGVLVPNIAGLLVLGREERLRELLPTHEIAFQVIGPRGEVPVNDFWRGPVLKVLDGIEERFAARNDEQEYQFGLLRMPVPNYSPEAFREAVSNAVAHRDYTCLGTVYIQLHPDHLRITNPGGFPNGITIDNLLRHEPKPRNPRLTDVLKRIGLVERTGRGVDKIYRGQALYGRSLPDYSQTTEDGVRLVLRGVQANLAFAAFVEQQSRLHGTLELDDLLVLNHLQHERRTDLPTVAALIQHRESDARRVLERLVERGLVEARGERRGRVFHLSAALYRQLNAPAEYVRAHGFDSIRQEAMVMQYIDAHGRITRREAADLCAITGDQASLLLRRLVRAGKLRLVGVRRSAFYERV